MDQSTLQQAVAYLRQHQNSFSITVLKEQLQKAGYPPEVIEEAVKQVTGGVSQPIAPEKKHWDIFELQSPVSYPSVWPKILDFIIGFIGFDVIAFVLSFFISVFLRSRSFDVLGFLPFFFGTAVIVYFWNKRRYLAAGMLVSVILTLVGFALLLYALSRIF